MPQNFCFFFSAFMSCIANLGHSRIPLGKSDYQSGYVTLGHHCGGDTVHRENYRYSDLSIRSLRAWE